MSAAISPSSAAAATLEQLQRIRVRGGVAVAFAHDGRSTRALRVEEADGYRVRFPANRDGCEAVLINTGGGVAGGDRVRHALDLGAGAQVSVASVGAELVYRAASVATELTVALSLEAGAALLWAPLETILHSGARLTRRVEADLAEGATLTFMDILVLGRRGSGERVTAGHFDDRWCIRRGGALVHMEATRLDGDMDAALQRPAVGDGAHVIGTLLHIGDDCAAHLEAVRAAIGQPDGVVIAASAWGGKLVVRALGARVDVLRRVLDAVAEILSSHPSTRSANWPRTAP